MKAYNCNLRINKDSTVNFIYSSHDNTTYGEHIGTIRKVKDTLYSISTTMTIGQFSMKSFHQDTIYIQLDSKIARQLDKIQVEYADGKTRKQLQDYDRLGNLIRRLKIPIDKTLFNDKKGKDFIVITINPKNFLTDNFLSFKIPYGSAVSFTVGEVVNFNVIIKNKQLYTTGIPPLQIGHFSLKTTKK